ncbi:MAG TPA: hypothetical protein VGO47_15185 [Chlamydiales bacterium]|nr:hypothetical protein [Chlamydiales bacterium]
MDDKYEPLVIDIYHWRLINLWVAVGGTAYSAACSGFTTPSSWFADTRLVVSAKFKLSSPVSLRE